MNSNVSTNTYIYRGGNYVGFSEKWEGEGDAPPKDVTDITFHPNVTAIGHFSFGDCVSLANIVLPPTVTTISEYAFSCCSSLTNITLPSSLTTISSRAFYGCSSLESIILPSSLTYISRWAFSGCGSLRSVLGPTPSNDNCHSFHSLLATTGCEVDFIELAIELHPKQLKEVDANGNLPLHIALSSPKLTYYANKKVVIKKLLDAHPEAAKVPNNDGNLPLHIQSCNKGSAKDIDTLLAAYPEAAELRNNNGKLPLFMALKSRKEWCDGVETLLNAFPAVTIEVDRESNMFPFMFAASEEAGSCLDSIYAILRTRPEMNTFYCAKAQEESQVGSKRNRDAGSLHSSKRQRRE